MAANKKRWKSAAIVAAAGTLVLLAINMTVSWSAGIGDYALEHADTRTGSIAAKVYGAAAPLRFRQLARSNDQAEAKLITAKDEALARPSLHSDPEWLERVRELGRDYERERLDWARFADQMKEVAREFEE